MGANKDKGTSAEREVVKYLRSAYWPHAERRALTGRLDRGDVTGVIGVVFQVKHVKQQRLATWFKEVLEQAANDGGSVPVLVVRTFRKNVRQWDTYVQLNWLLDEDIFPEEVFARMDLETVAHLLHKRGY